MFEQEPPKFLLTHLRRKCDFNVVDLAGVSGSLSRASAPKTSLPGALYSILHRPPFSDVVITERRLGDSFPNKIALLKLQTYNNACAVTTSL